MTLLEGLFIGLRSTKSKILFFMQKKILFFYFFHIPRKSEKISISFI